MSHFVSEINFMDNGFFNKIIYIGRYILLTKYLTQSNLKRRQPQYQLKYQ